MVGEAKKSRMVPTVKRKRCGSCGVVFLCKEGACWCDEIELDLAALEAIEKKYEDCLCETCLKAVAGNQVAGSDTLRASSPSANRLRTSRRLRH